MSSRVHFSANGVRLAIWRRIFRSPSEARMIDSRIPTMKHNPGFLAADELIASFVARRAELESLLEVVRNNTREANQHVLVIGRRGMGKTMLLHRLELAIKQDLELGRRWYP